MKNTIEDYQDKHIKAAKLASRGIKDNLKRAEAIYDYFHNKTDHPHPGWTYDKLMFERRNDYQFAQDLLHEMSFLTGKNEWLSEDFLKKEVAA